MENKLKRLQELADWKSGYSSLDFSPVEYFLIGCSSVLILLGITLTVFNRHFGLPAIALILNGSGLAVWIFLWMGLMQDRRRMTAAAAKTIQNSAAENRELRATIANLTNQLDEFENQQDILDRIVEISASLVEMSDVESTLLKIIEVSIAHTKADTGSLILIDDQQKVTGAIFPNRDMRPDKVQRLATKVLNNGIAGWVAKHNQPAIVFDARQDKRWITIPDAPYKDRSALSVPIVRHQQLIGVLTLIHKNANHFKTGDLNLLVPVSNQIGMALTNAQIFDEQRKLIERQTALNEVLQGISEREDLVTTAQKTVDTVVALTGWSACAIFTHGIEQGTLTPIAITPAMNQPIKSFPIDSATTIGAAVVDSTVGLINDLKTGRSSVFEGLSARSELFVPMTRGDETLGVLYLADVTPFRFFQADIDMARSIGEATAMTLANVNLVQALSNQTNRLNSVIEANRDGVIMVGGDYDIVVINQNAITLLQLPGSPTEWLGRSIEDVCDALAGRSDDLVASLQLELDHLTTLSERASSVEFHVGRRMLQVQYLPIIAQELHLGRVIALRDVTDQRLAEQMRNEITHTMVHDLRNPLHIISSGMNVLADYFKEELEENGEKRQLFSIINNNAGKLLNLVNGILEISRLESNRMPLNLMPFNFESEIIDAKLGIEPLALKKNVAIKIDMAPNTALVEADRDLYARILQNILDNALKFTRDNSEIQVTTRWEDDRSKIVVSVSDEGEGVAEYLADRLFEKFQTGQHKESGSGLGLAFCKMALEAHGESIWIANSSNQGTTFSFTIKPYRPVT